MAQIGRAFPARALTGRGPAVGTTYNQSCNGTLSFSGSVTKSTSKVASGSLTFSAVVVKQTAKVLAGGLTFAGTTVKRTDKPAAGTLSFSGTMSAIRTLLQAVNGVLSFASGAVSKSTAKSSSGSLNFSGGVIKVTQKLMLGTLSFSAQVLKTTSKIVSGVLTFAGTAVANLVGAVTLGALTAILKVFPALRANSKVDPTLKGGPKTK